MEPETNSEQAGARTPNGMIAASVILGATVLGVWWLLRRREPNPWGLGDIVDACDRAAERLENSLQHERLPA